MWGYSRIRKRRQPFIIIIQALSSFQHLCRHRGEHLSNPLSILILSWKVGMCGGGRGRPTSVVCGHVWPRIWRCVRQNSYYNITGSMNMGNEKHFSEGLHWCNHSPSLKVFPLLRTISDPSSKNISLFS